jgi:hypothetical protein
MIIMAVTLSKRILHDIDDEERIKRRTTKPRQAFAGIKDTTSRGAS